MNYKWHNGNQIKLIIQGKADMAFVKIIEPQLLYNDLIKTGIENYEYFRHFLLHSKVAIKMINGQQLDRVISIP
ncbi:MAG: hypothetical protein V6005_01420 [Candidatus Dasytiphilus stammeri]